jgi:phosphatidylglycerophosphatase A
MSREPSPIEPPSILDRFAWMYATGCGFGRSPKAPGTVGSLLGPVIVWAWQQLEPPSTFVSVFVAVSAILIGVFAAGRTARRANCKDPGFIVCDEIAAFAIVFAITNVTWLTAALGFAWFRMFDIAKPWPIRRLEHLPGGWGIMADDLLAGVFAAAALQGTLWLLNAVT